MSPAPTENPVVVGRILGPWGVQGWLQIYSYTVPREGIFGYAPWLIGGADAPVDVVNHKVSGKRLVVQLPGVNSPEEAARWVDQDIAVERGQLPALEQGEFYWHDLIGCSVINRDQDTLGVVRTVFATGANDVLEVAPDAAQKPTLIPFVMGVYIDSVDIEAGLIVVDWPIDWLET